MSDEEREATWPLKGSALIVDDDDVVRRTYSALLEEIGISCHTASTCEEGLDVFDREGRISLVITDHCEDGVDSEEFVTLLRSRRPGVIVIGSSGRDCKNEFAHFGVERFMRKPWHARDLIGLISGRISECVSCGLRIPLRRPFPGEVADSWVCRSCGARYSAMIDQDSPADIFLNVRSASF
jgi:CheY-like chemotaxis protein